MSTRTVTGTWLDAGQEPRSGTITFKPSSTLLDTVGNKIITTLGTDATLDKDGSLSISLTDTDTAGIDPTGWVWTVTERLSDTDMRTWNFELPASASPLDLSDAVPVVITEFFDGATTLSTGTVTSTTYGITSDGSVDDVVLAEATTSLSGLLGAAKWNEIVANTSKLSSIEASATADQTGAEIKTAYELEADTNAFTDTEKTKLTGIETSATADQSDGEIKTAYENNADTNAFDDAAVSKLGAIEASADVTDSTNVLSSLVGQAIVATSFTGDSGSWLRWTGTQAAYDLIGAPDADTLYVIVG